MAQNYEIDIQRWNGQDYDTLLPTPASHASTHQANGSDPLTLQTGNYGGASIPTSAYQDASVTRAKLAQDALYSPIMVCSGSSYDLSQNECGKTLINSPINSSSSILEYHIGKGNSQWISAGSEFAFISSFGQVNLCFWDNILIAIAGESSLKNAPLKLKISENFGMVALKKLYHDPEGTGDIWLVTGNVEVVT